MANVPIKYLPKRLTRKDKKKYSSELKKSRKAYKKGKYVTRKKVKSFKSKPSNYVVAAKKIYDVETISANPVLASKTGCSVAALSKIVKKGQGAYYSSGSRPNQTGHSWGRARLASAITGGKAAAVDYTILEKGCKPNSKALRLAKQARKKHGYGTRRVPKTRMVGGFKTRMVGGYKTRMVGGYKTRMVGGYKTRMVGGDTVSCQHARDGVSGCRDCCQNDQVCLDVCMSQ
jgi:hypothetical protein